MKPHFKVKPQACLRLSHAHADCFAFILLHNPASSRTGSILFVSAAMCIYSYQYFSQCRHQGLVLEKLCDQAEVMAQQHAQSASHGRKGETKGSVDQVNGNDNKGYQPSPDLLSSSAPPRDSVNINHPQPSLEHHYSQHTLPISSLDEDEPESDTDWPELVRRPQYEQETQPVGRSTSASSPAMVLKRSNAVHEGVQHRTSRMPVAAAVQSQENK